VSPNDKLKIVAALQRRGEVVAITGDVLPDASAVRQSDVGLAIGMVGSPVTRQAAHVVLHDERDLDNISFHTIMQSMEEGRRIFDNVLKGMIFLLTCNISQVLAMLFCVVLDWPLPFEQLVLLWVNCVVLLPLVLALGLENLDSEAMQRKPRHTPSPSASLSLSSPWSIFDHTSRTLVWLNGLAMSAITLLFYGLSLRVWQYTDAHARGLAYCTLATLQCVHVLLSRSLLRSIVHRQTLTNFWMALAVALSAFLLLFANYVPSFNQALGIEALDSQDWGYVAGAVAVHVVWVELQKAVARHCRKRSTACCQRRALTAIDTSSLEMV